MKKHEHSTEQKAAFWKLGDSLAIEVIETTSRDFKIPKSQFTVFAVIMFFFVKSYKTFQAARVLNQNGFAEDALALTRSLFESALQSKYIEQDPDKRAQQFMEFDPVQRYRQYKKLVNLGVKDYLTQLEARPDVLKKLKSDYERYAPNYSRSNWWGDSIRWLAEQLGENHLVKYYTIYWLQSAQVHSGLLSMNDFLKDLPPGLLVEWLSSDERATMVAIEACANIIGVVESVDTVLSLGLRKSIDDSIGEFNELVKGLGEPIPRSA